MLLSLRGKHASYRAYVCIYVLFLSLLRAAYSHAHDDFLARFLEGSFCINTRACAATRVCSMVLISWLVVAVCVGMECRFERSCCYGNPD